jgi:RNAse (barnase) inhibitor barstar
MARVRLDTRKIVDWPTFHDACALAFGFPGFYGRNMNAWIDCLTDLRMDGGMSRVHLAAGEVLHVEMAAWNDFQRRLPHIAQALVECSEVVNDRLQEQGEEPVLALESC